MFLRWMFLAFFFGEVLARNASKRSSHPMPEDPGDGREVNLLRAGFQLRLVRVGAECFQEARRPPLDGRHLFQDAVADLAGGESVELPAPLQFEEDGVGVRLLQFGGELDGLGLRLLGGDVPVGGEEADAGGEIRDGAVLGDGDLEQRGFSGLGLPGVEVELGGDHDLRRCLRKSQTSRKQNAPILHIFARKCTTVAFFLCEAGRSCK